jgi:hypothetical protein
MHGRCLGFALSLIPAAALLATPVTARPQDAQASPQESVAEAARRAREQKKNSKQARVITEDELSRNARPNEAVNVIGSEPKPGTQAPTSSQTPTPSAAVAPRKGSDTDRAAGKLTEQITQLKEQIASAQKDLDFLQRQLTLDSEAFYSQTDFARDTSGQAKLDNEKQQIHDKQQEIDSLKSQLAALEQERRRIKPEATEAATPAENNPTAPSTSAPPAPAPPPRPK